MPKSLKLLLCIVPVIGTAGLIAIGPAAEPQSITRRNRSRTVPALLSS